MGVTKSPKAALRADGRVRGGQALLPPLPLLHLLRSPRGARAPSGDGAPGRGEADCYFKSHILQQCFFPCFDPHLSKELEVYNYSNSVLDSVELVAEYEKKKLCLFIMFRTFGCSAALREAGGPREGALRSHCCDVPFAAQSLRWLFDTCVTFLAKRAPGNVEISPAQEEDEEELKR